MSFFEGLLLYVLFLSALAIGYLLGRRHRRRGKSDSGRVDPPQLAGLNALVEEDATVDVEHLLEDVPLSDDTCALHLAFATLMRRRGRFDVATDIHQKMLAATTLKAANKHRAEIELALDYHGAGLIDRAENLLLRIIKRRNDYERQARELLVDIYESSRDYAQALEIGLPLLRAGAKKRVRFCHLHCELAGIALAAHDVRQASRHVQEARAIEPTEARVYVLQARIAMRKSKPKDAQQALRKAADLNPGLLGLILPEFRTATRQLAGDAYGVDNNVIYHQFLRQQFQREPSLLVFEAMVEAQIRPDAEAFAAALPSGSGVAQDWPLLARAALGGQDDTALRDRLLGLISEMDVVVRDLRCSECGLSAQAPSWQCPGCRSWGTYR
ncbi:MAG: hypothetical protein AAF513_14580 [Pseudomonadota bacterium]